MPQRAENRKNADNPRIINPAQKREVFSPLNNPQHLPQSYGYLRILDFPYAPKQNLNVGTFAALFYNYLPHKFLKQHAKD